MDKIKYVHMFPPHFFTDSKGQRYIVPTWQPVADHVTADDIEWTNPFKRTRVFIKKVKASKRDTYYTIEKLGDEYICDCPGAKFRNRNCKHIKEITYNNHEDIKEDLG